MAGRYGGAVTRLRGAARAPLAVLALVGTLALSGCGDDSADAPGTDASTDAAAAESTSAAPTDAASSPTTDAVSPSPSETAPTVAPATGPPMELDGLTLNVPEGWEISITGYKSQGAFNASGGPGAMTVSILGAVPGESFETTLQGSLQSQRSDGLKPQRLEDITLDGVPAWVISGSEKGTALQYEVGGVVGNDTFGIGFQYLTKPPPDVQSTIDSVLASVVFDAA